MHTYTCTGRRRSAEVRLERSMAYKDAFMIQNTRALGQAIISKKRGGAHRSQPPTPIPILEPNSTNPHKLPLKPRLFQPPVPPLHSTGLLFHSPGPYAPSEASTSCQGAGGSAGLRSVLHRVSSLISQWVTLELRGL